MASGTASGTRVEPSKPAEPAPKPGSAPTSEDGRSGAGRYGGLHAQATLPQSPEVADAARAQVAKVLDRDVPSGGRPSPREEARLRPAVQALGLARFAPGEAAALRPAAAALAGSGSPNGLKLLEGLLEHDTARVSTELSQANPGAEAVMAASGRSEAVRKNLVVRFPGAEALGRTPSELRAELDADLALGGLGKELSEALDRVGVSPADQTALMGVMSEVRAGFRAGAEDPTGSPADRDMQRSNWIHTRMEVVKATRAFAAAGQTDGDALLSTLLGTLASDAFKDASVHSLLWHNRAGAELTLPLLAGRHFDLSEPRQAAIVETAKTLALEHQITPAMFMSAALANYMSDKAGSEVVSELVAKVGDPLGAPREGGEIAFSPEARAALEQAGIPGWATMDPDSAHFQLSQIVALADVLQYAAPDGILKIAVDIRDPEQKAVFMRDGTIKEAVSSSVVISFEKGLEAIVDPTLRDWALAQAKEMRSTLSERVEPEVQARLADKLGAGPIPYWDTPVSISAPLSPEERSAVDTVKSTYQAVLAELGGVPLQPFGEKT